MDTVVRMRKSNPPHLLDKVRSQSKFVADSAKLVKIRYDKIANYTDSLPFELIDNPPLDSEVHLLNQGERTLLFFLALESINFGSGYFPHLEKEDINSGYFTIASRLKQYFEAKGEVTATNLIQLTATDCATIFLDVRQDDKNLKELMGWFADSLNQLGRFVLERFKGDFLALIKSVEHSAVQLVTLLTAIPSFRDFSIYRNQEIPILKRAQITVADLSLAFDNQGLGHFYDLEELTIFADNMVPFVLQQDGILEYDEGLYNKINNQVFIPSGSEEEVEIRACAIHAVELIKEQAIKNGISCSSKDLDYLLWNRGLEQPYVHNSVKHLTKSMFY